MGFNSVLKMFGRYIFVCQRRRNYVAVDIFVYSLIPSRSLESPVVADSGRVNVPGASKNVDSLRGVDEDNTNKRLPGPAKRERYLENRECDKRLDTKLVDSGEDSLA